MDAEEAIIGSIPDESLDPIQDTLMKDSVILPSSTTTVILEDMIIRDIFLINQFESIDSQIVYLETTEAKILSEGSGGLRLSKNLMERVLVNRLSGVKNFDPPPFYYLTEVYGRACAQGRKVSHLKDESVRAQMELVVDEAKKLAVFYFRFYLRNPDMFPRDMHSKNWPLLPLVLDVVSSSIDQTQIAYLYTDFGSWCPCFLDDLFKSSGFETMNPIFEHLYVDLIKYMLQRTAFRDSLEGFQQPLRVLKYLVSFPLGARALVCHPRWIPKGAYMNGRAIEIISILGPFFHVSAFPDHSIYKDYMDFGDVGKMFFSESQKLNPLSTSFTTIKTVMNNLYDDLAEILRSLLKNISTRESVLEYIAEVINKNDSRIIPVHPASSGMFVNLSAVMLRLCGPFLDANSTEKDKIDPKYVFYGSRLDFKEITALHAFSEEVTEWLNKNNPTNTSEVENRLLHSQETSIQRKNTSYSLICECFFMTARVLNLGLLKAFSDFKYLVQDMSRCEGSLSTLKTMQEQSPSPQLADNIAWLENGMKSFTREKLCYEAQIVKDEGLLQQALSFYQLMVAWLVGRLGGFQMPLPQSCPMEFACMPEHFVEDVMELLIFTSQIPRALDGVKLDDFMNFIIMFMASPEYIRNPYLRAKMVEVLRCWMPHRSGSPSVTSSLFEGHQLSVQYLVKNLLKLYVDIEFTGSHTQLYDKLTIRHNIAELLGYLWQVPIHQNTWKQIAAKGEEIGDYLNFLNFLINDSIFLLDESLSKILELSQLEAEMSNTVEWERRPAQERQERSRVFHSQENIVRLDMKLAMEDVGMLAFFTEHITAPFLLPQMVERVASMLNYFLSQLVGPQRKLLILKDPEKYELRPKQLLKQIVNMCIHLAKGDHENIFLSVIAKDRRSFKDKLFTEAANILRRFGEDPGVILAFDDLGKKVSKAIKNRTSQDMHSLPSTSTTMAPCTSSVPPSTEELYTKTRVSLLSGSTMAPSTSPAIKSKLALPRLVKPSTPIEVLPEFRGLSDEEMRLLNESFRWECCSTDLKAVRNPKFLDWAHSISTMAASDEPRRKFLKWPHSTSTMAAPDEWKRWSLQVEISKPFEIALNCLYEEIQKLECYADNYTHIKQEHMIYTCKKGMHGVYQCQNALWIWYNLSDIAPILGSLPDQGPVDVGKRIMKNIPEFDMIKGKPSIDDIGVVTIGLSGKWIAKSIHKMIKDGIDTWAPKLPVEKVIVDHLSVEEEMHGDLFRRQTIEYALMSILRYSKVDLTFDRLTTFPARSIRDKALKVLNKWFPNEDHRDFNNAYGDLLALWYGLQRADWIVYVSPVWKQEYVEMCFTAAKLEESVTSNRHKLAITSYAGYRSCTTELDDELFKEAKNRVVGEQEEDAKLLGYARLLGYTAEEVVDCVFKYTYLKNHRLAEFEFNINDEMFKQEENTFVYLLDTQAKIRKITDDDVSRQGINELKKASELVLVKVEGWEKGEERTLGVKLLEFTEAIEESCLSVLPHILCEYLYDLSKKFNSYFSSSSVCKVGAVTDTSTLLLCEATAIVMEKCFHLLGISPTSPSEKQPMDVNARDPLFSLRAQTAHYIESDEDDDEDDALFGRLHLLGLDLDNMTPFNDNWIPLPSAKRPEDVNARDPLFSLRAQTAYYLDCDQCLKLSVNDFAGVPLFNPNWIPLPSAKQPIDVNSRDPPKNSRIELFSFRIHTRHIFDSEEDVDEDKLFGLISVSDKYGLVSADGESHFFEPDFGHVSLFNHNWCKAITTTDPGGIVYLGNPSSGHSVLFSSSIQVGMELYVVKNIKNKNACCYPLCNHKIEIDLSDFWGNKVDSACGTLTVSGTGGRTYLYYILLKDAVDAALEVKFETSTPHREVRGYAHAYYGDDFLTECELRAIEKNRYMALLFRPNHALEAGKIWLIKSVLAVPIRGSLVIQAYLEDAKSGKVILDDSFHFMSQTSGHSSGIIRGIEEDCHLDLQVDWKYNHA